MELEKMTHMSFIGNPLHQLHWSQSCSAIQSAAAQIRAKCQSRKPRVHYRAGNRATPKPLMGSSESDEALKQWRNLGKRIVQFADKLPAARRALPAPEFSIQGAMFFHPNGYYNVRPVVDFKIPGSIANEIQISVYGVYTNVEGRLKQFIGTLHTSRHSASEEGGLLPNFKISWLERYKPAYFMVSVEFKAERRRMENRKNSRQVEPSGRRVFRQFGTHSRVRGCAGNESA